MNMKIEPTTNSINPVVGWTKVPNTVLDNLDAFSDSELRVLLAGIREINGWHKQGPQAMSLSWLQARTGMSETGVRSGLAAATGRGFLQEVGRGKRSVKLYELAIPEEPTPSNDPATTTMPEDEPLPTPSNDPATTTMPEDEPLPTPSNDPATTTIPEDEPLPTPNPTEDEQLVVAEAIHAQKGSTSTPETVDPPIEEGTYKEIPTNKNQKEKQQGPAATCVLDDSMNEQEGTDCLLPADEPKKRNEYERMALAIQRAFGQYDDSSGKITPLTSGPYVGTIAQFLRGTYEGDSEGKRARYQLTDNPMGADELAGMVLWYRSQHRYQRFVTLPRSLEALRNRCDEFRALPPQKYAQFVATGRERLDQLEAMSKSEQSKPIPWSGSSAGVNAGNFLNALDDDRLPQPTPCNGLIADDGAATLTPDDVLSALAFIEAQA